MDLDRVKEKLREGRDFLARGAAQGVQNIQYSLPEALRNYAGQAEWQEKKQGQDLYGGDFEAQERADKMMGFGTDVGGMIGMIKASHGSPHAFERFSMDKIGTGEGAQAYGHGLYFGEGFDSPVAKEYQRQLAADVSVGGKPFYSGKSGQQLSSTGNQELDDYLLANLGDVAAARKNVLDDIRAVRTEAGYTPKEYQKTLADLRKIRGSVDNSGEGHLYNVELRWPDAAREAADPLGPEHFLHWDKPISEQPKSVQSAWNDWLNSKHAQAAMKSLRGDIPETGRFGGPLTGQDIHSLMYEGFGSKSGGEAPKVASYLAKRGIPGIRYLDQGSRGAGQGTHNYVIFDENIPEIVSRNGQAIAAKLRETAPRKNLEDIISHLESQGLKVDAYYNPNKNSVSLSRLVVPKESRGQGIGSKAMQDLINFADEKQALMELSPSTDFGASSVNRLKDFYSRFGFVPNTGRAKDFSISESMYRKPKETK